MENNAKVLLDVNQDDFIKNSFSQAVTEVIRTMAGFDVHESSENSLLDKITSGEISGVMIILGDKNALVSLTMNRQTAAVLVAYMTGILPEELTNDDICDGVAEMVNVVAGRVKAELKGTDYHFALTPPFTILGENHCIMHKSRIKRISKKFFAGEMEIFLSVAYL